MGGLRRPGRCEDPRARASDARGALSVAGYATAAAVFAVNRAVRLWLGTHADDYEAAGIDLTAEPVVGLGSVCRRQATGAAEHIVQRLQPLRLHGFGMKGAAIQRFGSLLASADSMAWSYAGRIRPDPTCPKRTCANCAHYALDWRRRVLEPARPSLFTPAYETGVHG